MIGLQILASGIVLVIAGIILCLIFAAMYDDGEKVPLKFSIPSLAIVFIGSIAIFVGVIIWIWS